MSDLRDHRDYTFGMQELELIEFIEVCLEASRQAINERAKWSDLFFFFLFSPSCPLMKQPWFEIVFAQL